MRGLYVHIPFCVKKCHYCDFVITTMRSPSARRVFLNAVKKEALAAKEQYGRLPFDTLYFGGGTPSVMDADELLDLVSFLRAEFDIRGDAEFTCEINPGDADLKKLHAFYSLGINRISVGAQSFSDALLKEMNRSHDAAATRHTMKLLREIGFKNISLDLILKLPGQSVEDFRASVLESMALGVQQICLYDLDVHEKTVYGARMRRGELVLPDEEAHHRMFEAAIDMLDAGGYGHYEVSNFAKPGFESKHNLIYWHNEEYLGLGPGAFSYLRSVRYQVAADVRRYYEKFSQGDWTPDTADQITPELKEAETLMTGMRLKQGVDLGGFKLIRAELERKLPKLAAEGLIERTGDRIKLTPRARFIIETVLTELLPDAGQEKRVS